MRILEDGVEHYVCYVALFIEKWLFISSLINALLEGNITVHPESIHSTSLSPHFAMFQP